MKLVSSRNDWQAYWPRFGDAIREVGFSPNEMQEAFPDEFLFKALIELIRKLDRYPTVADIRFEKRNNPDFPGKGAFRRLGRKHTQIRKLYEFIKDDPQYSDIKTHCEDILDQQQDTKEPSKSRTTPTKASVYLAKSGRHYKIGRTNDSVRRANELNLILPEKLELIHEIETDDPSGVESYWHNRFADKRTQGEWFNLTVEDVRAFRKWRKIA